MKIGLSEEKIVKESYFEVAIGFFVKESRSTSDFTSQDPGSSFLEQRSFPDFDSYKEYTSCHIVS